jgi:four helix bundle protein
MKNKNVIRSKSFDFALQVIGLYKKLIQEKEFIISKQLLKSGTSIGANVEEATAAQSRKDFISKMAIASKEARETKYWLKLLAKSNITNIDIKDYLISINEIVRILTAIVKTTKNNS